MNEWVNEWMSNGWMVRKGGKAHWRNSPFADLGWKISWIFFNENQCLLPCEERIWPELWGASTLPSPAKFLFLFKAPWEIPAVFSGVLWTAGLRFLILWSRKEQISDSWLQRKNHYVYQRLGSSVTFGARGREGKMSLFPPRVSEISGGNREFRIPEYLPFLFLSFPLSL